MIDKIIPFSHKKISEFITKNDIALDMTMGNGNDTLFLSSLAKHVYAFDIQEMAVKNTTTLLNNNKVSNVTLIHDTHANFMSYIKRPIKCAVFNLGYLPGGDKKVTTNHVEVVKTIDDLLLQLDSDGIIVITVYPGFKQGEIESEYVLKYAKSLSSRDYNVLRYDFINKNKSPYNIFIEKN